MRVKRGERKSPEVALRGKERKKLSCGGEVAEGKFWRSSDKARWGRFIQ